MNGRRLRLVGVSFDLVEYHLVDEDGELEREVTVLFGYGPTPIRRAMFPHGGSGAGETLGDERLDEEVRQKAAEELVRLEAAVASVDALLRATELRLATPRRVA